MSLEIENPSPLVRLEVAGHEGTSIMASSELGSYGETTVGVSVTFPDANGVVLAGFCKSELDDSDGVGGVSKWQQEGPRSKLSRDLHLLQRCAW